MLAMSRPSDPTESLARARVMALKAFEMDQELGGGPGVRGRVRRPGQYPDVSAFGSGPGDDILALIDEQLGEELFSRPTGMDTTEPMSEVRIFRESPTESAGVGVGAAAGDPLSVISVDPNLVARAGEFRRDSTGIFESYTQVGRQLRAAWAGWATRSERMASVESARLVSAARRLNAAGRTDEALEVLDAVCVRSPEHEEAWEALGLLYASRGEYEELLDMRRMWVDHAGGDAESVDQLDERLRRNGAEGYWEWRLAVLQERASEGEFVSPVYLAAAQAAVGDTDQALASLEDAVRDRDRRLVSLRTDAVWDVIRPDPRFASLVRGITNAPPRRRMRR